MTLKEYEQTAEYKRRQARQRAQFSTKLEADVKQMAAQREAQREADRAAAATALQNAHAARRRAYILANLGVTPEQVQANEDRMAADRFRCGPSPLGRNGLMG